MDMCGCAECVCVCVWSCKNMRFISGVSPTESISEILSVILGILGVRGSLTDWGGGL